MTDTRGQRVRSQHKRRLFGGVGPVPSRAERREAFAGLCGLCGLPLPDDDAAWNLDHVVPISRGGRHVAGNLQPTHALCNYAKGALRLDDALRLLWVRAYPRPTTPEEWQALREATS